MKQGNNSTVRRRCRDGGDRQLAGTRSLAAAKYMYEGRRLYRCFVYTYPLVSSES